MASKQVASAVRNAERLATALERKQERQAKSTVRMNHRLTRAEESLARAESSLLKAQLRVEKAKAKLDAVRVNKSKLGEKQMKEVDTASERAAAAKDRADKLAAEPSKPVSVGGTVETEQGETRTITSKAGKLIAKLVGRQSSGSFAPLDCAEAQSILSAIDARIGQGGSVGDIFTVRLKGRKMEIVFSIEAEGLAFQVGKLVAA